MSGSAPMNEPSVEQLMQLGVQRHQSGLLSEAEPIYRQVLERDPGNAGALQLLGVLAHQVGRNEMAVELIQRAIAIDPRVPGFHNNLGEVYRAMSRPREAIA